MEYNSTHYLSTTLYFYVVPKLLCLECAHTSILKIFLKLNRQTQKQYAQVKVLDTFACDEKKKSVH